MIKFVLPSFDLGKASIEDYLKPQGSFFYYYSGIGNIKVHVEDQVYVLKSGKYLLYFLIKSTCQI
jgi:hypothetical protein